MIGVIGLVFFQMIFFMFLIRFSFCSIKVAPKLSGHFVSKLSGRFCKIYSIHR